MLLFLLSIRGNNCTYAHSRVFGGKKNSASKRTLEDWSQSKTPPWIPVTVHCYQTRYHSSNVKSSCSRHRLPKPESFPGGRGRGQPVRVSVVVLVRAIRSPGEILFPIRRQTSSSIL